MPPPTMATLPDLLAVLDALPEPKVLIGPDYRIAAVNAAYRRQFSTGDRVEGRTCYEVSHRYDLPCDQAGESCPLRECQATGEARRVLHVHYTHAGQEHVEVEISPVGEGHFLETMRVLRHAGAEGGEARMLGYSRPFLRMLELAKRVSARESSVLLLGESGTGKELLAQAIHDMSPRRDAPFVAVDCSGLTETLFETELFGHEKGAFTGALNRKIGLVEVARGGTLFLDEVGDIPLPLQVKLLRLLESGTYRRVGGVEPLRADFRLITATHRDVEAMVDEGGFRQDLYYRINVFPIHLPALRERLDDLLLLAEHILGRLDPAGLATVSPEAIDLLAGYSFPGNVRELRNLLERALILADSHVLKPEHFISGLAKGGVSSKPVARIWDEVIPLHNVEAHYLAWARKHYTGDRRQLAVRLGISERTLYRKLQSLGGGRVKESSGS